MINEIIFTEFHIFWQNTFIFTNSIKQHLRCNRSAKPSLADKKNLTLFMIIYLFIII